MDRDARIAHARAYAQKLAAAHAEIAAVILGGSVARGDWTPISDVDLLYFHPGPHPLPVAKHTAGDVFIDIEGQPVALLNDPTALEDPYLLGYMADAIVLYDPAGVAERCHRAARHAREAGVYRDAQLEALRQTVGRHLSALDAAISSDNALGICHAAVFALWTLIDHALVARAASPGGARSLARLRRLDGPLAAQIDAVELGCLCAADGSDAAGLLDTLFAEPSPFFAAWIRQVRWLLLNGQRVDGLHALWIALGLYVAYVFPEASDRKRRVAEAVARRWLARVGWTGKALAERRQALGALVQRHIGA